MDAPRYLLTLTILLSLFGCKIEISVPPGGKVQSDSGAILCAAGKTCVVDVTDVYFDEVFRGIPIAGYTFEGWKKRERGFCGGNNEPCRLATTAFGDFPALMGLLESDEGFYLEPVFDIKRSAEVIDVQGLLKGNINWEAAKGIYRIIDRIEIHPDAVLNIGRGVKIISREPGAVAELAVWGSLNVNGTAEYPVSFKDVSIKTGDSNVESSFRIMYADISSSDTYARIEALNLRSNSVPLSVTVKESSFTRADIQLYGTNIQETYGQSVILAGNRFHDSDTKVTFLKSQIAPTRSPDEIILQNNLYTGYSSLRVRHEPKDIVLRLEYNSILSYDLSNHDNGADPILTLDTGSAGLGDFRAGNNYWGTTDLSIIESMILDGDDTLQIKGLVNYKPILVKPHTDTPEVQ